MIEGSSVGQDGPVDRVGQLEGRGDKASSAERLTLSKCWSHGMGVRNSPMTARNVRLYGRNARWRIRNFSLRQSKLTSSCIKCTGAEKNALFGRLAGMAAGREIPAPEILFWSSYATDDTCSRKPDRELRSLLGVQHFGSRYEYKPSPSPGLRSLGNVSPIHRLFAYRRIWDREVLA